MNAGEFDGADRGDHYVFKSFPDDNWADTPVSLWLNEMHKRGYQINTFQEVGRAQLFVMEKLST